MKSKSFYMIGGQHTLYRFGTGNSIIDVLSKNTSIIQIGDSKLGFKIEELKNLFNGKIDDSLDFLNIFIDIHSGIYIDDNKFKIQTWIKFANDEAMISGQKPIELEIIEAADFVTALVKATNGIKLNILFTGCHGANFSIENNLKDLPIGSKVITMSDKDVILQPRIFKDNFITIFNTICKDDFKIDYIAAAAFLNQVTQTNNPTITIVNKEGIKHLDINLLAKNYADSAIDFLLPIFKLFDANILDKDKCNEVIKTLKNKDLTELTPPKNNTPIILKVIQDGTSFTSYKESIESYYFKKDLDKINFKIEDYEEYLESVDIFDLKKKHYEELIQSKYPYSKYPYSKYHEIKTLESIINGPTPEQQLFSLYKNCSPFEFCDSVSKDYVFDHCILSKHSIALGLVLIGTADDNFDNV